VGLFEAMEELGIRPGVVAGTSSGAVLGAFYACGFSACETRRMLEKFRWTQIVAPTILARRALSSTRRMEKYFRDHLDRENIEDLPVRLKIAAVDLHSGSLVGFAQGSLSRCLAASSCVPGVFEPVRVKGNHYYDAGGIFNLPLELFAGENVRRIIAGNTIGRHALMKEPRTATEVVYQAYLIRTMHLTAMRLGPLGWQGKGDEEEVILVDYRTEGANPASIRECATLIEAARDLALEVLGKAFGR
jgi:NTE family protein